MTGLVFIGDTKELVELYENCKGTATFTYVLTGEGDTLAFSLDQKGALTMEINICTIYNYKCHMTIESLDQTYLPKFIEFFKSVFRERAEIKKSRVFKMRLFSVPSFYIQLFCNNFKIYRDFSFYSFAFDNFLSCIDSDFTHLVWLLSNCCSQCAVFNSFVCVSSTVKAYDEDCFACGFSCLIAPNAISSL